LAKEKVRLHILSEPPDMPNAPKPKRSVAPKFMKTGKGGDIPKPLRRRRRVVSQAKAAPVCASLQAAMRPVAAAPVAVLGIIHCALDDDGEPRGKEVSLRV